MILNTLTQNILTAANDSSSSSINDEVLFGGPGNDSLSNSSGVSPFLIGGQGQDRFTPNYNGFTTILDRSGSSDTFVDPVSAPGAASTYRLLVISDGPRLHVAIVNSLGLGVFILDVVDDQGGTSIENFIVGEALSAILPGNPPIGTNLSQSQFLSLLSVSSSTILTTDFATAFGAIEELTRTTFQSLRDAADNINNLGGDAGANVINGTDQDNILAGFEGNDQIIAGLGDDIVDGGAGNDTYSAQNATQSVDFILNINGGIASGTDIGTDSLSNIERVIGGSGDDTISLLFQTFDGIRGFADGGAGNDTIRGGSAQNTLIGGRGQDQIFGGSSADNLFGNEGEDTLNGSFGDDVLSGGQGADILNGDQGSDTFLGDQGADEINGGEGFDTVDFRQNFTTVNINLTTGASFGGDAAGDSFTGIERFFTFMNGENSLTGDAEANVFVGGSGNDQLRGLGGDDVLIGGFGADLLNGGDGFDTVDYRSSINETHVNLATNRNFGGDAQGDRLFEIEQIFASLTGNSSITGNNSDNTLIASAGDNQLRGAGGDDILIGGSGADLLNGGNGFDTVDYRGTTGTINVNLTTGVGFGSDAEGDRLIGIEQVISSSAGNNTIIGNAANNVLVSFSGADQLSGMDGDDILRGGRGADILDGGSGTDTVDYRGSSAPININLSTGASFGGDAAGDQLISVERIFTAASGSNSITGDAQANILFAGSGNDQLRGLDGNDLLQGGFGGDLLNGGAGFDTADYRTSTLGVFVNLRTGVVSRGEAAGDTLLSIENVFGSDSQDRDILVGSQFANQIRGFDGDDFIAGLGGNDFLQGGGGADTFHFDAGGAVDRIQDFEDGIDRIEFDNFMMFSTAEDALANASQEGMDVVFNFGSNGSLIIEDATIDEIIDDVFIV